MVYNIEQFFRKGISDPMHDKGEKEILLVHSNSKKLHPFSAFFPQILGIAGDLGFRFSRATVTGNERQRGYVTKEKPLSLVLGSMFSVPSVHFQPFLINPLNLT